MDPNMSKMSMMSRSMTQSKHSLDFSRDTWPDLEVSDKDALVSREDLRPVKTKLSDDIIQWFEGVEAFVWHGPTGSIFGRSLLSWARLLLFYLVFYAIIFLFCAILYALLLGPYIDNNYPRLKNMQTPILGNPGMGFRPMPDHRTTLIRFEQGKPSSYKPYADHIQAYLLQYENEAQESEVFIDCTNLKEEDRVLSKACRFSIDQLGNCTWQRDYGYDDGQPCVLLKLNKVFDWRPDTYNHSNRHPDLPAERLYPGNIAVTCVGEDPMDEENMGPLAYYPPHGFPIYFYPYLNQEGYRQPLVFVKFLRPKNGVVINVWCRAWARNIFHHRFDRAGSIHFEMLID